MSATLFLLTLSGPQLAPSQFPGTQHPTVWYYNSHNVPMPWPANSYFTLTMNGAPPGAELSGPYFGPRVVTSYYAPPAAGPAPATLVVHLPADARLTIDGYAPRSTSGTRWFVTPPLGAGRDFHYQLRAEVERGGKRLTRTREVAVRAGQQTDVTLDFPGT
jgi:uncharacterized protein (TIGR03000 family)